MRLKIDRAAMALEELASKGPLKCENLRGLDEKGYDGYVKGEDLTVIDGLKMMPPLVGKRQVVDETNYRIGWVLEEDMTNKMLEQSMAMKKMIHVSSVTEKRFLTKAMLQEQLDLTRGLMMMAYPGFHGLGEWEPIWVILENKEQWDEKMNLSDDLEAENTVLWCVSKELQRGKTFADHFGKNEKSKMIIKATKKGGGAPAKEPMISEEEHKKMLAFYHKKQ
jgi:cilia- and flagella-associated protein 298